MARYPVKVVHAYPPNFAAIKAVFPKAASPGVLFTYGDTVYNPSGIKIPPQLIAHERVHIAQQQQTLADLWWSQYLWSAEFRLDQEIPAHQAEYRYLLEHGVTNRALRRRHLPRIAKRLSGPLYGHLIGREKAIRLLKAVEAEVRAM